MKKRSSEGTALLLYIFSYISYSALIAHRILVLFALGFLAHSSAEGLITSLDTSL